MLTPLLVALGAVVGAPARFLLDRAVQARLKTRGVRFPLGTLLINLSGSLVLGYLLGLAGLSPSVLAAVGTGFCGTYTTYSTFGYETMQLTHDGYGWRAGGYVLLSVLGGVGLAALGFTVGHHGG